MAESYYRAVTKTASVKPTKLETIIESKAVPSEEIESLTKALKDALLEERCKSLSAWAEQHRLLSEKHSQAVKKHEETIKAQHTSLKQHKEAIDMQEKMIAAHTNMVEAGNMQIKAKEARINKLEETLRARDTAIQSHLAQLKQHEKTIESLKKTIQSHEERLKKLSQASLSKQLKDKTRSVLRTAHEVLDMTAQSASTTDPAQLRMWLAEVGCAIKGIEEELDEE